MWRWPRLALLGVLSLALAGSRAGSVAAAEWPLWTMGTPPAGAEATLAAGETLVQIDVDPRGGYAIIIGRSGTTRATLRIWDFKSAPVELSSRELRDRSAEATAFSAFDGTLFVASAGQGAHRDYQLDRFAVDADKRTLRKVATVYSSKRRIGNLVTGLVMYDEKERLYFALELAPGRFQIIGVRGDGTGRYEVTSPTGAAGELTEQSIRAEPTDDSLERPKVVKTTSAVPVSLGPEGTLIWRDHAGALKEQAYTLNWEPAVAVPGATGDVDEVLLANGYFRERWTKGKPGFELVNRTHGRAERIAGDVTFASRPVVTTSGRAFLGEVRNGTATSIRTFAMPVREAAVRVHREVWSSKEDTLRLEKDGIVLRPTDLELLYNVYERVAYQDLGCGQSGGLYTSVFASLDGFFEVLTAGFESVFMLGEQKASRPALSALMTQMKRVAKAGGQKRLGDIADAVTKTLAGNLKHPEGRLIAAGSAAASALPINLDGAQVDYADFAPRGPYVVTKGLSSYFQAFKLANQLQVSAEEQALLASDAKFMAALRRWVDVQRPFLAGTRHPMLFDVGVKITDVPAACIPQRIRRDAPLLYPLAWSMDSEILEGSVVRSGVGPECGSVPGRSLPTGLDLLAGLGSPKARELNAPEYRNYPQLSESHVNAAHRAAVLAKATTFVDSYLRLVQMLSTETRVPEAVSPDLWQRRLLQSALGAWVGLRHTLVLVSETGAAECGDERHQFELLQAEPARGAVDPLPDAWRQVGALLDLLAAHAQARNIGGLAPVLREQAGVARAFGVMAEKQLRGQSLTAVEYQALEGFGGAVEHPYLLFKSMLKKDGQEGELPAPEPMSKIVDIQRGADGKIWHVAVGHPLEATVLLGDRGVLVPALGGVYSYYEVIASRPLNDDAWRAQLGTAKPPAWVQPLLQLPRPTPTSASPVPGRHAP